MRQNNTSLQPYKRMTFSHVGFPLHHIQSRAPDPALIKGSRQRVAIYERPTGSVYKYCRSFHLAKEILVNDVVCGWTARRKNKDHIAILRQIIQIDTFDKFKRGIGMSRKYGLLEFDVGSRRRVTVVNTSCYTERYQTR
jgi:hypothetical protein